MLAVMEGVKAEIGRAIKQIEARLAKKEGK